MRLTREDLQLYYRWTPLADNDPRRRGTADDTAFDRASGEEMLAFLNANFSDRAAAHKAERLIRIYAPDLLLTRREVASWVAAAWNSYPD